MKRNLLFPAILSAVLCCGITLAQEPVQNIDPRIHPNLADAQRLLAEANQRVIEAQKDNRYDMKGHAEKARALMADASRELKLAAEAANAAMRK